LVIGGQIDKTQISKIFSSMLSGKSEADLEAESIVKLAKEGKVDANDMKIYLQNYIDKNEVKLVEYEKLITNIPERIKNNPKVKMMSDFLITASSNIKTTINTYKLLVQIIDNNLNPAE
jgi:hypothetical protein